jgi:polar amino acid transport system substrate-binding protein
MRPPGPPIVASWIALLLLLAGCGGEGPKPLVVATEAEFRPFEYVLPSGEIVGFDIDLARAIAKDMGAELKLRNVKFETIFEELNAGYADLVISGVTVTEERKRTVAFSEPYFFTVTALLLNKEKAGSVTSVSQLNDPARTVAVKEGTTGAQAAERVLPKARLLSHKTENGAALDVAEGRADAFLYDLHSVEQHHAQHPDRTVLLRTPITVEAYAIAARPGDAALLARVDKVLAAMRADGRLAEIAKKHGPSGSIEPPR